MDSDLIKIEKLFLSMDIPYSISQGNVLTASHIKLFFNKEGEIRFIKKPSAGKYKVPGLTNK